MCGILGPSIDCILVKQRLMYLGRVLRKAPPPLIAILGAQTHEALPVSKWAQQVRHDLCFLYENSSQLKVTLAHPDVCPRDWYEFMIHDQMKFKHCVHALCF